MPSIRQCLGYAFAILFLSCCGGVSGAWGQVPGRVTVPDYTGPIPVTVESWPLMADDRLQHPVDLAAAGYVEEEFFVTGRANVYDWDEDDGATIRSSGAPYTTRILVRRPLDAGRSSGNAYVELGNNARQYDWGFSWSLSHEYFIENGDTWVLVTYNAVAIEGLKTFDPERYQALGFPNPNPQPCGRGANVPSSENGLRWDMLSQVGALLRDREGPTSGIERVYAMSHGPELPTYVQSVHRQALLDGGRPIYDGFILHRHNRLTSLNECGAVPLPDDARHVIRNAGVPVVRIVAETDVLGTRSLRRDDSDAPGDEYRLYEVAGAPHADGAFYRHIPVVEDQQALGTTPFLSYWPFADQCVPEIPVQDFPLMSYVVNAAIRNLDVWVRDGVPAPRAARVEIRNAPSSDAALAADEFGNALGGVRSSYLDVPSAHYVTSTGGPGGCRNMGYSEPFGWERLERTYSSFGAYRERVRESVGRLVEDRWLRTEDGVRILSVLGDATVAR